MYYHQKLEEGYKFYWRAWLRFTDRLGIDIDLNLLYGRSLSLSLRRSSHSIVLHLSVPFLFSVWLKFKGVLWYGQEREIGINFHDWAVWINPWVEPMDGKYFSFHFDNFIFGKAKYSEEVVEERNVMVPMPEKSYLANAQLFKSSWSYPRWFTKTIVRVNLKIEEGIPHEGKGENSWDCGRDATFGLTCNAKSIAEGVGQLVGHVLNDRVRYGGWSDWNWQKA